MSIHKYENKLREKCEIFFMNSRNFNFLRFLFLIFLSIEQHLFLLFSESSLTKKYHERQWQKHFLSIMKFSFFFIPPFDVHWKEWIFFTIYGQFPKHKRRESDINEDGIVCNTEVLKLCLCHWKKIYFFSSSLFPIQSSDCDSFRTSAFDFLP